MKTRDERNQYFDPRTKLAVLIVLSIIMMGGSYQTKFYYFPAVLPLIFFYVERQWESAVEYVLLFSVCLGAQNMILPEIRGTGGFLLVPIIILPLYFLPTIGAARYLISTTTAGEFTASMDKMHMPRGITVSMAVIFRFFPTLREEWRAIGDAMKLRGIGLFGKKAGKVLEYRLVPMLMCSIKIGDELSAAALTRGLDSECRRTSIHKVCLKGQDAVMLCLCFIMLTTQIFFWIGG